MREISPPAERAKCHAAREYRTQNARNASLAYIQAARSAAAPAPAPHQKVSMRGAIGRWHAPHSPGMLSAAFAISCHGAGEEPRCAGRGRFHPSVAAILDRRPCLVAGVAV